VCIATRAHIPQPVAEYQEQQLTSTHARRQQTSLHSVQNSHKRQALLKCFDDNTLAIQVPCKPAYTHIHTCMHGGACQP
jgi:hypothetical protein